MIRNSIPHLLVLLASVMFLAPGATADSCGYDDPDGDGTPGKCNSDDDGVPNKCDPSPPSEAQLSRLRDWATDQVRRCSVNVALGGDVQHSHVIAPVD